MDRPSKQILLPYLRPKLGLSGDGFVQIQRSRLMQLDYIHYTDTETDGQTI